MARPRSFDTSDALERAMQLFWTRGYEATSMADLTRVMGLSKSSLYDTFGSKHALFLAALERYVATVIGQIAAAPQIDAPARRVIEGLFERAVDRMSDARHRRGCFLNNSAVEVAATDPDAAARIADGLKVMEKAMLALVQRGQQEGRIRADREPRALARFLVASLNGILVMGKADPDRAILEDVARTALTALG